MVPEAKRHFLKKAIARSNAATDVTIAGLCRTYGMRPAARVQEIMDMHDNSFSRSGEGLSGNLPGQVVLVLQGGGALGSYQAGVYQALHEAGIEPDWVVGTSIGAINPSLIAGHALQDRLPRLEEFWG